MKLAAQVIAAIRHRKPIMICPTVPRVSMLTYKCCHDRMPSCQFDRDTSSVVSGDKVATTVCREMHYGT